MQGIPAVLPPTAFNTHCYALSCRALWSVMATQYVLCCRPPVRPGLVVWLDAACCPPGMVRCSVLPTWYG